MKQLGSLVLILLLLGVGISSGLADAQLTASQQIQPQTATVGETAIVTLTLTYNGDGTTQIMVVPILPPGIVTDMPGAKSASLNSGGSVPISYPIRAVESGNYQITSEISYTEQRTVRRLNMLSDFMATGGSAQPSPGPSNTGGPGPSMSGSSMTEQPMSGPLLHSDTHTPNDSSPSNNSPMTPPTMPEPNPTTVSSPIGSNSSGNSSMPS